MVGASDRARPRPKAAFSRASEARSIGTTAPRRDASGQEMDGRFIWQLVGVLDT